ncbi:MAG: methyltransferase domain-containing protein [Patescibacteria group bacterium]|nr:methyltransferase domain-containing protein [Patescibacteria group bacterium]
MFSNPEKNVAQLGLKEGMKVADLGAGSGFYAKAAAKGVGHTGKVYAIEVQKELVTKLEEELKKWGTSNIECVWGDIERKGATKLADKTVDAVILSNVLFQVEDKLGLLDEVKRIIKPEGQILLVDWIESFGGMGPTENNIISKKEAESLFIKRGFKKEKDITAGPHHYGIIFKV